MSPSSSLPLRVHGLSLCIAAATVASVATVIVPAAVESPLVAPSSAAPAAQAPAADIIDVDFSSQDAPTDTAANRTVTPFGDPQLTFDGKLGRTVAQFDDDGYVINLNDPGDKYAVPLDGFSLECSFRYNTELPPNEVTLCGNKAGGGFALLVDKGQVQFSVHDGTGYKKAGAPIQGDRWYHATGVFGGGSAKLYLDGELVAEVPTAPTMQLVKSTNSRGFAIGADSGSNAMLDNYANARIGNVQLYGQALDDADVAARAESFYNRSAAEVVPDVLNVDINNAPQETPFVDIQHQDRDYSTDGEMILRDDQALNRRVAKFDNTAVLYTIGDTSNPDGTYEHDVYGHLGDNFSVECTFRYDAPLPTSGEAGICSNKQSGGFSLSLYQDYLTFAVSTGEYNYARVKVEPHRWYHVVGVLEGSVAKLYVNGELAASVRTPSPSLKPPTNYRARIWTLASDAGDGSAQYHGNLTLANSNLYSRGLTPDEISALSRDMLGSNVYTVPTLTSVAPAQGSEITQETAFEATWSNPDLVAADMTYTLDGAPLKPGDLIGPGLKAGEHTITATGSTVFGQPINETVSFTSPNNLIASGTTNVAGANGVALSANAVNPSGGDITTTFYKGEITTPSESFQGLMGSAMPTTLDFEYTDQQEIPAEGRSLAAHEGKQAFQRFDVPVKSFREGQSVRWTGMLDPTRQARLLVWNPTSNTWDALSTGNGVAQGETTLTGALKQEHVADGSAHVLVLGIDPFALLPETEKGTFADPADYDFSIAHMTDTQFLSEGATEDSYSEQQRDVWARAYKEQLDWIVENRESKKIAYMAHSGDVIENWVLADYGAEEEQKRARAIKEFEFAKQIHDEFEKAELPHGVLAGNHDNRNGTEDGKNGEKILFNDYFGPEDYEALSNSPGWQQAQATYHPWKEGDNSNHYDLFTAPNGMEFVVVHLGYGVDADEAAWADSVLKQFKDRNGIVVAHSYLGPSTAANGHDGYLSYDGSMIQSEVVDKNPNVAMVLSGHENGVAINVRRDVTDKGNNVLELLSDYQEYEIPAGEVGLAGVDGRSAADMLKLGASFLRLFQFRANPDSGESTVQVTTYSPFLDNFGASEYDPRGRYNGNEDEFALPIQLTNRSTSFSTTSVEVTTPTDEVIGEVKTKSGWPASVTWTGLEPGKEYAWYAVSRDAGNDTELTSTLTQMSIFTATRNDNQTGDFKAPLLTVPKETVLKIGDRFDPLAGVEATDEVDGDIISSVNVAGAVDTSKAGTYELVYTATDAAGNQTTATRTVTVSGDSHPGSSTGDDGSSTSSSMPATTRSGLIGGIIGTVLGATGAIAIVAGLINTFFPNAAADILARFNIRL
ncbi:LamG-like jellyroll fold domain-containing protein [Corynebacterium liangguodongii]|nr:LamG-like jellyroll fold domain-containing protein [Corynebacterium liangguodongii]